VDDLEEARPGARRDGFWCLRFSTNEDDNPDDGEVVEIDGRVYRRREAEEIPLRMGREPDATRSCVVERWEKQR
jgi:hypothetical protein